MNKRVLCGALAVLISLFVLSGSNKNCNRNSLSESFPTVSQVKENSNYSEPGVFEEYYNGALKITWRYVTEDEKANILGAMAGDWRLGVVDSEGNTLLEQIYMDINILSKDRIYAFYQQGESKTRMAYIFDSKGNTISTKKYRRLYFYVCSSTGNYFPVGLGEAYLPDSNDNPAFYLIDFNGNRVLDNRIDYVMQYGKGWSESNDPNAFVAVDYKTKELYVVDSNGMITKK